MTDKKAINQLPEKDRLVTRPESDPLPTPEDPRGAHALGYPADPKPALEGGQGDDPHAGDLDHSV